MLSLSRGWYLVIPELAEYLPMDLLEWGCFQLLCRRFFDIYREVGRGLSSKLKAPDYVKHASLPVPLALCLEWFGHYLDEETSRSYFPYLASYPGPSEKELKGGYAIRVKELETRATKAAFGEAEDTSEEVELHPVRPTPPAETAVKADWVKYAKQLEAYTANARLSASRSFVEKTTVKRRRVVTNVNTGEGVPALAFTHELWEAFLSGLEFAKSRIQSRIPAWDNACSGSGWFSTTVSGEETPDVTPVIVVHFRFSRVTISDAVLAVVLGTACELPDIRVEASVGVSSEITGAVGKWALSYLKTK